MMPSQRTKKYAALMVKFFIVALIAGAISIANACARCP